MRLAIARLENLNIRSNGCLVIAVKGKECDAKYGNTWRYWSNF